MIPCKRPRVTVDQRVDRDAFDVNCRVPGCDFTYPRDKTHVALKTDAESTAARHRQEHRVAVPKVDVDRGDRGFVATCACGWKSYDGAETSRQSVDQTLTYHLSSVHGLVTC